MADRCWAYRMHHAYRAVIDTHASVKVLLNEDTVAATKAGRRSWELTWKPLPTKAQKRFLLGGKRNTSPWMFFQPDSSVSSSTACNHWVSAGLKYHPRRASLL